MKVFIINQPVRNVIRAGNNLIVETEPSNKINPPDFQQLTTTPHMDKNDEKELEIENISKILKSDQGVHDNRMDRMDHQMDPFETTSTDYQNNEVKPNIGKGKTKKKPVPPNQKDDVYWERVSAGFNKTGFPVGYFSKKTGNILFNDKIFYVYK